MIGHGELRDRSRRAHVSAVFIVAVSLTLLSACHRSESTDTDDAVAAPIRSGEGSGVVLTAQEVQKLGIVTTPAQEATSAPEVSGYGVVLSHELIAQAVAEIATAEAALRQSQAAMTRITNLADTPGAFSAETREAAAHQLAADEAALTLAQRKLSAAFGEPRAWQAQRALDDVASGRSKLIRVSFPPGTLVGGVPQRLRIARLDSAGGRKEWESHSVWAGPVDATVPGRNVFAEVGNSDMSEGERLQVWAATGPPQRGVVVPSTAVVVSDAAYWCYVEKPQNTFVRTRIEADQPLAGGYFVTQGVAVGDAIVTTAAGLLLAREINPATEAE
ncbi:MAG TPA: hypothetical protein VKB34_15210 [Povalibacter sp.]|nr:hypothetical protein [Povalibacter sp.]